MKSFKALFFCFIIIFGCNYTNSKKKDVDTSFSADISDEERINQLINAKYNRGLILGKWKIINLKIRDTITWKLSDIELKEIALDTYRFSSDDEYTIYKGKKILEKGTFEWMAQNREIVMTADDDTTVSRLLIWSITDKYMKVSVKSFFMTFKKTNSITMPD